MAATAVLRQPADPPAAQRVAPPAGPRAAAELTAPDWRWHSQASRADSARFADSVLLADSVPLERAVADPLAGARAVTLAEAQIPAAAPHPAEERQEAEEEARKPIGPGLRAAVAPLARAGTPPRKHNPRALPTKRTRSIQTIADA